MEVVLAQTVVFRITLKLLLCYALKLLYSMQNSKIMKVKLQCAFEKLNKSIHRPRFGCN